MLWKTNKLNGPVGEEGCSHSFNVFIFPPPARHTSDACNPNVYLGHCKKYKEVLHLNEYNQEILAKVIFLPETLYWDWTSMICSLEMQMRDYAFVQIGRVYFARLSCLFYEFWQILGLSGKDSDFHLQGFHLNNK